MDNCSHLAGDGRAVTTISTLWTLLVTNWWSLRAMPAGTSGRAGRLTAVIWCLNQRERGQGKSGRFWRMAVSLASLLSKGRASRLIGLRNEGLKAFLVRCT